MSELGDIEKLEAVLFYKNEPVTYAWLAKALGKTEDEIHTTVGELEVRMSGRGLILMEHEGAVMLATSPSAASLIEGLAKDELGKELSKAALETLSIVLYMGPVGRSEIDYIRGVNSQFILRHLQVRGLVEKIQNKEDLRAVLYQPTLELLAHMGLSSVTHLPSYAEVRKELDEIKKSNGPETPTS